MRQLRFVSILAGCGFVFLVPALHAQFIAGGINGIDWVGTVQKHPYTATWTEKSVRNAILSEEFTIRYARDSSGRIYEEFRKIDKEGHNTGGRGFVYDPIGHTLSWLNSNTKQAIVTRYADSDASAILRLLGTRSANPYIDFGFGIEGADFGAVKPEGLGTKTIAGVTAQGTRITTPQVIRGSQPLTIAIETWWSTKYGVLLQKIYSPHYVSGTTRDLWSNTLEVTDFKPGEPDAAFFRVPEGYTVEVDPNKADAVRRAQGGQGVEGRDSAGAVQNRPYRGAWITKSVAGPWHSIGRSSSTKAAPGSFDLAPEGPASSTGESTKGHLQYSCDSGLTTPDMLIYARDSSGRVYQEFHNEHAQIPELVNYCVFDPVAHTLTSWNSHTKLAIVRHAPADEVPEWWNPEGNLHAELPKMERFPKAIQLQIHVQDLGTKIVAGATAQGMRITRGNDPSLTSTEEIWTSTECGIILQRISDRPLYRRDMREASDVHNTLEATDFKPGEPDASLFNVPEGYSVKDVDVQ